MLYQRFAKYSLAVLPRTANRFMGFFTGHMDDIQGNACHVGDHDGAIGGFAFNLWRARVGMAFRSVVSFLQ